MMKQITSFAAALLLFAGCVNDTETNIALNTTCTSSTSYDYNLTAQLLTDGIVCQEEPSWMSLRSIEGEFPRREKEWTIDQGPYSFNRIEGSDNKLEYVWSRRSFSPRTVRIAGSVYTQGKPGRWSLTCESDGAILAEKCGKTFPGKASGIVKEADPNKQGAESEYLKTSFRFDLPVNPEKPIKDFTIRFSLANAHHWEINAVDFSTKECFGHSNDTGPYSSKEARGMSLLAGDMFTSAWMSKDGEPQQILMDLKTVQKINGIRIHWIHPCVKGGIEASANGTDWTEIADIKDCETLKAKARYLRFNMEGADASGHFCIGEIEVLGHAAKGEPVGWSLKRADGTESGALISTEGFKPEGWLPAVVPGTVLYSYIAAGAVPDPTYSDNNQQVSESFFNSDFWYRGVLKASPRKGERTLLEFDGINWKAQVWMNGKEVGTIEGAFRKATFDVTDIAETENVVAVRIVKNANYGAVKEKTALSPDFNGGLLGADNPTFHASVGWDWIPTVRGRECGIWNDVRIVQSDPWLLGAPKISSKVHSDGTSDISASVFVKNLSDKDLIGTLQGSIGGISFERPLTVKANESIECGFTPEDTPALKGANLALWWPNGMGEPTLHDAQFRFSSDGNEGRALSFKAGIREFTYADVDTDLKMFINGHRFTPKGGNWGFSESNLRYGSEEYDKAVALHKEMNLNMIRNWVGQIGDMEFYDACDRNGIVVWQDFWLANPADGPDPDDGRMFIDNARDYLGRIRSHACIGLYCGRNEGYPPASLNAEIVKAVSDLHGDIVYIPSSADDGVSGHGPYWAVSPEEYFTRGFKKFHSEMGRPAVMDHKDLLKTFSGSIPWPVEDLWGQHDFTRGGAQRNGTYIGLVRNAFGPKALESAESFAKYSQWINYEGYKAMYESNNVLRKGLLIWMSHCCWPSMSWQTYDYWFDRNGAFYGTLKACEPVHIQFNPVTRQVQVVNTGLGLSAKLYASATFTSPDGKVMEMGEYCSAPEDSTTDIIDCKSVHDGQYILRLELKSETGELISSNVYFENFKEGHCIVDYTAFPDDVILGLLNECCPGTDCRRR